MRIAVLTCILGDFDTPVDPKEQTIPFDFHRFTDEDFPPIAGVTPRMQYRIPKTHGWQMFPGYDYYIWLDGSLSLKRDNCIEWYLEQMDGRDFGIFAHPDRKTAWEETKYINNKLKQKHAYLVPRYENGLHMEQYKAIPKEYPDSELFHSGMFVYKNTPKVQEMLKDWWYNGTRYFTVDQIVLPYLLWKHDISHKVFDQPIYKSGYISLVSHHK